MKTGNIKNWIKTKGKDLLGKSLDIFGEFTGKEAIEKLGEMLQNDQDLSDQEKLQASQIIVSEIRFLELENKDRKDSRKMNIEIQQSNQSSWLAKNTAYILDLFVLFSLVILIITYAFIDLEPSQKELAVLGIGIFGGLSSQILHFHRGSTQGSKDKTKLLAR